jgi:hypothetical protein
MFDLRPSLENKPTSDGRNLVVMARTEPIGCDIGTKGRWNSKEQTACPNACYKVGLVELDARSRAYTRQRIYAVYIRHSSYPRILGRETGATKASHVTRVYKGLCEKNGWKLQRIRYATSICTEVAQRSLCSPCLHAVVARCQTSVHISVRQLL